MPAELTSTGSNFAPKQPLDALSRRRYESSTLTDALRKKYQSYINRDEATWRELLECGARVANCRKGKLVPVRNVRDGRYIFVKKEGTWADNKTVSGRFRFYTTKLQAEWLTSQPERDPICPSDDDRIEEYIADVKIIQDHYDKKFFGTRTAGGLSYERKENLSLQDFGTSITRFTYNDEIDDIDCQLLPFPACRWDIRVSPEESSYFIYQSKCSNAVLRNILDADINPDNDDDSYYGLRIIEHIATQGGNIQGLGKEWWYGNSEPSPDENTVIEMWLQPEAYCDIRLTAAEKTLCGCDLKGDLIDQFPDGLCVVGVNGMNTIIGLYAENHKEHIVSGIYHQESFTGVGTGLSDAVDAYKDLCDLRSQVLTHVKTHSTPAWTYLQGAISEQDSRNIGKPRKNIPIDPSSLPEGVNSVNQVIQALLPGNPAQSSFEMANLLNDDLQIAMQVTDYANTFPGVDNKTATGARIGDANAEMVLVPQHLDKARQRSCCDKVIFNLFKKYVNKPKFFATNAKNSITAGKYISGEKFKDVEIDFEIVANSEVSQTPYQQQMALTQLLQLTGGLPGFIQIMQMNPEMAATVATMFNVKRLPVPTSTDIARVMRRRVDQAKQILEAEMSTQKIMSAVAASQGIIAPFDNSMLAQTVLSKLTPPISPKEPFIPLKAQWLSDLLDTDELQYASMELRQVIEAMINRLWQVQTVEAAQRAYDTNMGAVMAHLPQIVGEKAVSEIDQEMQQAYAQEQQMQQQQIATAQGQQQLLLEGQKAQIADRSAEADHQRAIALQDRSHAQQLQLEGMKQRQAA